MSMWCPECNRINYNKEKCDFCGHIMKESSKSYKVPKNKGARILNIENKNKETLTLNKNTILVVAVVVIAISVAYLAINKYRENKLTEEYMVMMFGSSDPQVIKENINKSMNEMTKNLNESNKKLIKSMEEDRERMRKNIQNIGKM